MCFWVFKVYVLNNDVIVGHSEGARGVQGILGHSRSVFGTPAPVSTRRILKVSRSSRLIRTHRDRLVLA